mmetsp:Transcript_124799/g.186433  ORF Transcript_124799/g.186433 Transcript_124799/m.186433 type:complete len:201 (-) Transcript_124799:238-840(-)
MRRSGGSGDGIVVKVIVMTMRQFLLFPTKFVRFIWIRRRHTPRSIVDSLFFILQLQLFDVDIDFKIHHCHLFQQSHDEWYQQTTTFRIIMHQNRIRILRLMRQPRHHRRRFDVIFRPKYRRHEALRIRCLQMIVQTIQIGQPISHVGSQTFQDVGISVVFDVIDKVIPKGVKDVVDANPQDFRCGDDQFDRVTVGIILVS